MQYKDIEKWFDLNLEGTLRNSDSSSHLDKITNYILENCDFKEGSSILEVGCGDGKILEGIRKKRSDLKISGLDISSNQIDKARLLLPEVEFYEGNFLETNINKEFDTVFSFSTFQYIKKKDVYRFNEKCLELLSPYGRACHLSIPNKKLKRLYYYRSLKNKRIKIVAWTLSFIKSLSHKYGKDGSNWHDPIFLKKMASKNQITINYPSDSWYRFNFYLIK